MMVIGVFLVLVGIGSLLLSFFERTPSAIHDPKGYKSAYGRRLTALLMLVIGFVLMWIR